MTASIAEITEPVALISGPRLRENYRKLRELAGTDVLAVVKANAYGHGAIEVSRCLAEIGCPFFAVARFSEAVELRHAGIETPILVLGRIAAEEAPYAARLRLHVTLFSAEQARQYASALRSAKRTLKVHIKIDTGMGRLGQFPVDAPDFIRSLGAFSRLEIAGIYSHLAQRRRTANRRFSGAHPNARKYRRPSPARSCRKLRGDPDPRSGARVRPGPCRDRALRPGTFAGLPPARRNRTRFIAEDPGHLHTDVSARERDRIRRTLRRWDCARKNRRDRGRLRRRVPTGRRERGPDRRAKNPHRRNGLHGSMHGPRSGRAPG